MMKATIMANPKRIISKVFSNIFLRFRFRYFSNRLLKDIHQIIYHNRKKYHCATRIKDYFRYKFLIHSKQSPQFYNAKFREKFFYYFLDDRHLHRLNKHLLKSYKFSRSYPVLSYSLQKCVLSAFAKVICPLNHHTCDKEYYLVALET